MPQEGVRAADALEVCFLIVKNMKTKKVIITVQIAAEIPEYIDIDFIHLNNNPDFKIACNGIDTGKVLGFSTIDVVVLADS